jgi:predicted NUDIX family NTP pyrophosphohydrolase
MYLLREATTDLNCAMAVDRVSAGLLMYRLKDGELQVFLAHPGGPYFKKKDEGHWTIPKGEIHAGENLLDAAIREFRRKPGFNPPASSSRSVQSAKKGANWFTDGRSRRLG